MHIDKIMEKAVVLAEDETPVFSDLLETVRNYKSELSKKACEGADSFVKLFDVLSSCFDENKSLSDFIERVIHDSALDEYHKAGDEIEVTIQNNFDVSSFNGKKYLILSTVNAFGGKNTFLGVSYIVLGGISIILAAIFIIGYNIHSKKQR